MGEPCQTTAAGIAAGLHDHHHEPRRGGTGGHGRVPLPLAGTGALAADARNRSQHRARDAGSSGGAVRPRAAYRALDRQAGPRCRRGRGHLPVRQHACPGQQAAHACRYPPAGGRGSGASLATACWPEVDGYHDSADRNVLVVAIIEEVEALAHLDEIAATPGVDVLFIGTGDLSFSLGLRGQQNHPRVEEAAGQVLAAAARYRKIAGRPAGSPEQTQRYIDQGFLFFQAPSDLALLENGAQQFLGPYGITPARRQRTLY